MQAAGSSYSSQQSQDVNGQTTPTSSQQAPSLTQPAQPCVPSKDTCDLVEPEPQKPTTAEPEKKPQAATQKKHKTHHHKSHTAKKSTATPAEGPKKVVVRDGSTADPSTTLTPGVVPAQSKYSRESVLDLLSSADTNLKQATERPLNTNEQADVDQIRIFMTQANTAIKAGDLDRAHNLAMKAHLLSDDLVKR